MFFKRSKGEFRETDRVTRYKLIKSGKNWVRASVSRLGLFRVMRAGVDEKIMVRYGDSSRQMPADLVKGMVVLGALAGATTVANPVFAEENGVNSTLESEISPSTGIVDQDSFVLGTKSAVDSVSASQSISESESLSEFRSQSSSVSTSLSQSISISESHLTSSSAHHVESQSSVEVASSSHSEEISHSETVSEKGEMAGNAQTTRSEEQVKRLQVLALDLYTYRAQAMEIPGTESAIEYGDLALEAIRSGLSNPAIQIDAVESQAKTARNRLANAVLRATSGQRDPRNGNRIDSDTSLRAPQYNLGPANNALISVYNSDYINHAYNVVETIPTRNSIKSIGYASGSDRVNGINVPQTSALKNSAVAFNIVGTVGQTEVVTPGKIYNVSFVVTNTARQSVTRTLRIQVLPQNDGIRNPITAVTTSTFVNDTSNLAQAEKDKVWEAFKTANPNIATSKDFKSYSVSSSGVVTITYKDNTTNDVTAPVKRLAAPTVETRLLEKAYTQTPVTVTGAEPGSTVVLYNNDDEVGTAVADASGQAIVTPTVKLQTGGVTAKARILYGEHAVYSDASNSVAVTDATRPEVTAKLTVNGVEPKSTPLEGGGKNYTIYAGDDAVVTFTATDDSGKLKEMKVVARADLNDNALNGNFFGGSQYGTGNIAPITGEITATSANPATITTTIHLKDDLYHTYRNTWQRNVAAIDKASNMNRPNGLGEIRMTQGRLADRTPGVAPTGTIQVTSLTALTDADKSKVIAAVSAVNPEVANRIKAYTVNSDGTVTITYKDSTTNVVAVKLSDSDHSQSVSQSVSQSKQESISQSRSESTKQSTSMSLSLSTLASKSVSSSLSESLKTSVSQSQSTSTSVSLSAVKSQSVSNSLSESLKTSVSQSQSASASESLSAVKSQSVS
ncbi:KxYKxGKxW signal peptide domain-containing protein, partial [Streptococcus sp. OMI750]